MHKTIGLQRLTLRQTAIRCAAALTLGLFLCCAGCESLGPIGDFGHRVENALTGHTPLRSAVSMEDQSLADNRRFGINRLASQPYGRRPPYTQRYQQVAQYDTDWMVRATAVRALNRARDASATGVFIKSLSDENDLVRIEAAKALVNLPDNDAVPALLKTLTASDESRDVRIWSADALQHYRTLEVARTLANQLSSRDFGVAWEARHSLVLLTGRDLRYDETAWLEFLTSSEHPFG